MRLICALLIVSLSVLPGRLQADVVETAQEASTMIAAARDKLKSARSSKLQLRALVEAVRAYEVALVAMQGGLRELRAATKRAEALYEARREQSEKAIVSLQAIEASSATNRLWHPGGALASARAGLILSDLIPILNSEAQTLRAELSGLATLTALQEAAEEDIQLAREDMRAGRDDIQRAMVVAAAKAPPQEARVRQLEQLARDASELDALAKGLAAIPDRGTSEIERIIERDSLDWPLQGRLLRKFNEVDAAGVQRAGLVISAPAQSLVLAPAPAEISYSGPFEGRGHVIILEIAPEYLMVLGGLERSFVSTGDVVERATPLGLLGGSETSDEEFLIKTSEGTSAFGNKSLYIELRENGIAVDPAPWFLPN